MPWHYVLLFPHGEQGWHWALQLQNEDGRRQWTRISQRYYRFHLHVRLGGPTTLFCTQCLFQQFIVDAWAILDQIRQACDWTCIYNGLADSLADFNAERLGQCTKKHHYNHLQDGFSQYIGGLRSAPSSQVGLPFGGCRLTAQRDSDVANTPNDGDGKVATHLATAVAKHFEIT